MPVCGRCGEDNPDRFSYCGSCGASLERTSAVTTEERKVVSVLFVDLVGYTARSDGADPEDVRAAMLPYHALLKREVERYGGTVEKFIGDAVMGVFGAPVVHEDDAERAVRAALRIVEAVAELNEERPGFDHSVRAAVDTGEVVVVTGAGPDLGQELLADVVNTASRLQAVAPVGGVVVGEKTQRASARVIEYEQLEPVTVKGKARPLPIWRVVGPRGRSGSDVGRPLTGFVGREGELALLRQTYARMLRDPTVHLVTVTGEPGVGKTRLVAELREFLDDQPELVNWRQGRCLPYGEELVCWALGEIVKSHAGILESDAPEVASRKLADAVDAVVDPDEREWVLLRMRPLVALSPEGEWGADREESFAAWRAFFEAVGRMRPLVLVIEDLHWADDAMTGFVRHLVEGSAKVPILVVCTARPEIYDRIPAWGQGLPNASDVALSPLSEADTAALISVLLGGAVLPDDVQRSLLARAGGNPLYAEEYVRMLVDRGVLVPTGASWRMAAGSAIEPPETVQALVAARLDALAPGHKAVLQDAAVLGKQFWTGAVTAMSGLPATTVTEGLHELTRKELIRPARLSSVAGEREFSFWHLLIRDVAYAQLSRPTRAAKHRLAAEWIARMAGDHLADHAGALSHHYVEALALTRALGATEDEEELVTAAVTYLVLAGNRTMGLDMPRAEAYFTDALQLLPHGDPARSHVLAALGEAAWMAGRLADAEQAFRQAITESDARADLGTAGQIRTRLADLLQVRGDVAAAHHVLAEAVVSLEALPPSRGLASAYVLLSRQCQWEGRPDSEALDHARRALAIAEQVGAREQVVRARQFIGFARGNLGDPGGLEDLDDAVRLGLEWGLGQETAWGYLNYAGLAWQVGGPAQGLAIQQEGITFTASRGLTQAEHWLAAESTWTLFELGRWDEVLDVADRVSAWERGGAGTHVQAIALPSRARVLVLRGRIAEAQRLAQTGLRLARELGDIQVMLPALGTAALVRLTVGDLMTARSLVEEWKDLAATATNWLRALNLVDAMLVLSADRAADVATGLLDALRPRSAREAHSVETGRAIVAEARSEPAEAAQRYLSAAAHWADFGHEPERAQCLLGAGRCLAKSGRPVEAAEPLQTAHGIFVDLGAQPAVAETDLVLEQVARG